EARADAVFAISWQPIAVSVFTRRAAISLSPTQQAAFLARVSSGGSPAKIAGDLSEPMLDSSGPTKQNRPDYWLYFSTDRMSPFDNPLPVCRKEYLVGVL